MAMQRLILMILPVLLLNTSLAGADDIATLRNGLAIDEQAKPAAMSKIIDEDIRQTRNYPMQPPLIPHHTRGYEVNLQVNKCMSCHARKRTGESQAPMISVTHFMDRDGNFLAEISPRRYFCQQCHINQTMVREAVENEFRDMDEIISERAAREQDH